MLPRSPDVHSLVNSSITEEVICLTKGSSHVKPVIRWSSQGKLIDPKIMEITSWEVIN
jgi:hypothetical protein